MSLRSVDDPAPSDALRLLLITDGRGDVARLEDIVTASLAGGVRAVQLREHAMSARRLAQICERLRPEFESVRPLRRDHPR